MTTTGVSAGELDRRTYVGGSDVAAILGLDRFGKTPLTCYLSKRGELEGKMDAEKELFLKRRKRWEGPMIQMLKEEFEANILAVNQRYVDQEFPFMAAEIDYEWENSEKAVCNGEIKTVFPIAFTEKLGWGEAGTDQFPEYIHAQCQWGMMITGAPECVPAAMVGLDNMTFYHLNRDDETIAGMRETVRSFWVDNVLAGVPPDPINHEDMMRLFAKVNGKPVELDEATHTKLMQLNQIRGSLKSFTETEEQLKFEIEEFIYKQWGKAAPEVAKDNGLLKFGGKDIATWSAGRGAHLDQKKLKVEHPEIIAAYTLPHYFRAFRFKKG